MKTVKRIFIDEVGVWNDILLPQLTYSPNPKGQINWSSLKIEALKMKIENKVCTREQAIKLSELGIYQPTKTEDWVPGDIYSVLASHMTGDRVYILGEQEDAPYKDYHPVKLYDNAELGAMLGAYNEVFFTESNKWACEKSEHGEFATEAQAKANRLIMVLTDESFKPEDLNKIFID
jgi:hypothetical protein